VDISADDPLTPGCGTEGDAVYFQVGDYRMVYGATWNTDRVWYMPLSAQARMYFPMVWR